MTNPSTTNNGRKKLLVTVTGPFQGFTWIKSETVGMKGSSTVLQNKPGAFNEKALPPLLSGSLDSDVGESESSRFIALALAFHSHDNLDTPLKFLLDLTLGPC